MVLSNIQGHSVDNSDDISTISTAIIIFTVPPAYLLLTSVCVL